MLCKNCDKTIDNDSRYCEHCGANLSLIEKRDKNIVEKESRSVKFIVIAGIIFLVTAGLVAFFILNKKIEQENETLHKQQENINNQQEQAKKELKVGDEFLLSDGRRAKILWNTAFNQFENSQSSPLRGVVQIKIESENGSLAESDYNKMKLIKDGKTFSLSNQDPARGDYWFYLPCIRKFDGVKLSFSHETTIILSQPFVPIAINECK